MRWDTRGWVQSRAVQAVKLFSLLPVPFFVCMTWEFNNCIEEHWGIEQSMIDGFLESIWSHCTGRDSGDSVLALYQEPIASPFQF